MWNRSTKNTGKETKRFTGVDRADESFKWKVAERLQLPGSQNHVLNVERFLRAPAKRPYRLYII